MVLVALICTLVGNAGVFGVKIDDSAQVWELKDAIKAEDTATITGDAKDLELFLAKKGAGWLPSADFAAIRKGKAVPGFEKVSLVDTKRERYSTYLIQKVLEMNGMPSPQTRQIHVLVEVPKQGTSVSTVSQDGVFDCCSDPFFSQFSTANQVGDWLNFSSLLLLTSRQKLYIRSSYRVIADQALLNRDGNMVKYAVVTGTPGIGKSVFVYYVMWRLIKDKKRVLFFDIDETFYFDGTTMFQCDSLPERIPGVPYRRCSILLATTPRYDYISAFRKLAPAPDVFYMPLWSKDELGTIAPLFPFAAAAWQNRFEWLGGVPRSVLQDIGTDPQTLLMSACNSCSLKYCITLVPTYSDFNSKAKIAQTLIHIRSQEPYREYEVAYASELAMQVIARTKWRSDRAIAQILLGSCDGIPLAQSLRGYVFEPYCMELLEQGGTFVCRKLLSGADMRKRDSNKRKRGNSVDEDEEAIDIPPSLQPWQIAERVEVGQHANQLYVPRTSKSTAIDAWMPQFGGFQMAVGRTHDIKSGAADELAKLGQNGNRLFFLLPPLSYKTFTKKTPQTIEQYAILVPYLEQVDWISDLTLQRHQLLFHGLPTI